MTPIYGAAFVCQMRKMLLTGLLHFFTVLNFCLSTFDSTLTYFQRRGVILKRAEKPWRTYIQKLLMEKIHLCHGNSFETQVLVEHILELTRSLLQFRSKAAPHFINHAVIPKNSENIVMWNKTVSQPVGGQIFSVRPREEYRVLYQYLDLEYKFFFCLTPNLKENITVSKLMMQDELTGCSRAKLSVQHSHDNQSFVYCGILALFHHYTASSKSVILITFYSGISVDIWFLHSVIANDLLSTRAVVGNQPMKFHTLNIEAFDIKVHTYYVSVAKYRQLHLNFKTIEIRDMILIDGPNIVVGRKFKIENYMFFPTFQFLLQFQQTRGQTKALTDQVTYRSVTKVTSAVFVSDKGSTKLNVSALDCKPFSTMHCILNITVSDRMQLNITFTNIIYQGFADHLCSYGGLAVFDSHKHILNICENYGERRSRPARNIYITGSFAITVVYSYKLHSSIAGKLDFKATNCKSVRLNICQYRRYCYGCGFHSEIWGKCALETKDDKLCRQLMHQMTEGSHLRFTHRRDSSLQDPLNCLQIGSSLSFLLMSVDKEECGIIQIASDFLDTVLKVTIDGEHSQYVRTVAL